MPLPLHVAQDPIIEWFLGHCQKRRFPPKSTLIYAGDEPNTLYFILDGSVSVLIEDEEGKELVLAYLNPGDFFGEMALFDEEADRSAWVRTKSRCDVAEISYDKFHSLVKENPQNSLHDYRANGEPAAQNQSESWRFGISRCDRTRGTNFTGPGQATGCHDPSGWDANQSYPSRIRAYRWLLSRNGWSSYQTPRRARPHSS